MHLWGDDWFKNNGSDLYAAIKYIEDYLHKHHICVCGKEKFGTYRDEYLRFWDGGLYEILFGYRGYIGTYHHYKHKWMEDFVNKIHYFIYYYLDNGHIDMKDGEPFEEFSKRFEKRFWKGLSYINQKIGLVGLVHKIQAKHYNIAFQNACKMWPHITDELIVMVDGYKMIKPGKYGNVDGEAIHEKYWKPIDKEK